MISATTSGHQIEIPLSFHGYNLIKIIGSGSTCIVTLVEDQLTRKQYAAKIIPKKNAEKINLRNEIDIEIKIHQSLDHPNIIKFYESFEIKNEKEELIVIITEYCSKGDLITFAYDGKLKNKSIKNQILKGFLYAIKYLHSKGISHSDIKGENILLDSSYNAKICDFGYSQNKIIQDDEKCKRGTLYYCAPELFHHGKFNTLKTDIYAIGIMLYSLNELCFPFQNGCDSKIISQITKGKLSFKKNTDPKLLNLVVKCTNIDPMKRPTIDEIINDEYFIENNKTEVSNVEIKLDLHLYPIKILENNVIHKELAHINYSKILLQNIFEKETEKEKENDLKISKINFVYLLNLDKVENKKNNRKQKLKMLHKLFDL